MIIRFKQYQTTTLSKWMFSQKLLLKSSLLLNGKCSLQVQSVPETTETTLAFSSVYILLLWAEVFNPPSVLILFTIALFFNKSLTWNFQNKIFSFCFHNFCIVLYLVWEYWMIHDWKQKGYILRKCGYFKLRKAFYWWIILAQCVPLVIIAILITQPKVGNSNYSRLSMNI